VSAVIPAYNCQEFIAEAVESVLEQTWAHLECIAVDDGSTDRTGIILAGFGDRIRCLRTSNRGPAAARNVGARAANGELIAFLDADDVWEPTKIERQVALYKARPALGLVYCALRVVDRQGRHLSFRPAPDPAAVLRNTLLHEPPAVSLAQTGVIPRHVFFASGGFDERLRGPEDSDLAWRLAARFPIAAVREPLCRYRRHPGQRTSDPPSYARDLKIFLDKAFSSELLPPELKRLKRPAFAKHTLELAYTDAKRRRLRCLTRLLRAFYLSPPTTVRWLAPFVRTRARRIAGSFREPRGATSRAS
jgi:glycosyltransferase involved in cell wall biosynthesis